MIFFLAITNKSEHSSADIDDSLITSDVRVSHTSNVYIYKKMKYMFFSCIQILNLKFEI